ncbi:MAG: hypothetical protein RLZZ458_1200 [Planctomycetota bacterium]
MSGMANENLINSVLINLSRSFLQYLSECSPWVRGELAAVGQELESLAAIQREDVRRLAELLDSREVFVDFGSFPTEYTDLQFLALQSLMAGLIHSQEGQMASLADACNSLELAGDTSALATLQTVRNQEQKLLQSLRELNQKFQPAAV